MCNCVPDAPQNSASITELGGEFLPLHLRFQNLMETPEEVTPGVRWSRESEEAWYQLVTPISDRIRKIQASIAAMRATSQVELQIKATMLLEMLEENTDDAVSTMTRSLCNDLLALNSDKAR